MSPKTSPKLTTIVATLGLCAVALQANANKTLINEDWAGYLAPTSSLEAPWSLSFGGGTTPAPSKVDIVNRTIGGITANWALVGNNASNEPVGNPALHGSFETSSHLNISFSFMVPQYYGNTSQPMFNLSHVVGANSTVGLSLYLGPNYLATGSALGYRTSSNTRVNLINGFTAGELITVMLTNINGITGTYDIAWSTSGGITGSVTDIGLTNPAITEFNRISFGENSAVTSTSELFVGPVVVTQIPEPTTVGIACALGAFALVVYRRRKAAK